MGLPPTLISTPTEPPAEPAAGWLIDASPLPDLHYATDRQGAMAKGDARRAAGKALPLCWLPESQGRHVFAELPGRLPGDTLWFE